MGQGKSVSVRLICVVFGQLLSVSAHVLIEALLMSCNQHTEQSTQNLMPHLHEKYLPADNLDPCYCKLSKSVAQSGRIVWRR